MLNIIPQPNEITYFNSVCKNPENIIFEKKDKYKSDEEYELKINENSITINAESEKGLFYGKTTLNQIKMQFKENPLPCVMIKDRPSFKYRGFMLDCARHIISVDEIKKMINLAAMLKFNFFHWHISDDQGFRVELDSFPQLTKYGSVRKSDNFGSICKSNNTYSGYYTKAEIKEIIEYCADRFIQVIPEIDMPGHTSAILHVFPELSCKKMPVEVKTRQGIYKDNLCIGKKETLDFIKKLLDELCDMFPCEYFHIGGDEAPDNYRKNCPDCIKAVNVNGLSGTAQLQCLFSNKIKEYLKSKGKKAIAWNDILKGKMLDCDTVVQRWLDKEKLALKEANKGRKIIISDFKPYYFDYPYGMYSLKDVYFHNPAGDKTLTADGVKNILGIETPLWTEFIDNPERLEYLCIPRWFAISENAWTYQKNKNYLRFSEAVKLLCNSLKDSGYNCAEENDYNMPVYRRIFDTAQFFKAFLSK